MDWRQLGLIIKGNLMKKILKTILIFNLLNATPISPLSPDFFRRLNQQCSCLTLKDMMLLEIKTFSLQDLLDDCQTRVITESELTPKQREKIEFKIHFFGGNLYPHDAPQVKPYHDRLDQLRQENKDMVNEAEFLEKSGKEDEAIKLLIDYERDMQKEWNNLMHQIQSTPISIAQVLQFYNPPQTISNK